VLLQDSGPLGDQAALDGFDVDAHGHDSPPSLSIPTAL
jgi:hypothetical protein